MRPRKVILCVDHNEQTLAVRSFLLETKGYRVVPMTSSHDALAWLETCTPGGVDLVLCELLMPQMDGSELVRRARVARPGVPTLMVSNTIAAFERGAAADAFLPKGASSAAELLERVRIMVARKRGPKKQVVSVSSVTHQMPDIHRHDAEQEQRIAS